MAIIAALAVLVIGAIQVARRTAIETAHKANAKTIQSGMDGYYSKNKKFYVTEPVNFSTVTGALDVALQKACEGKDTTSDSDVIRVGDILWPDE